MIIKLAVLDSMKSEGDKFQAKKGYINSVKQNARLTFTKDKNLSPGEVTEKKKRTTMFAAAMI